MFYPSPVIITDEAMNDFIRFCNEANRELCGGMAWGRVWCDEGIYDFAFEVILPGKMIEKDTEETMKNQIKSIDELQKKENIIKKLKDKYKERVFVISTTDIFRNREKWADRVVEEIYNCNRRDMVNYAYHFSYVKFVEKNGVYGIVGGKGQFHWKNSGDICFFDINKCDNAKSRFMKKYNLHWYSKEIVILKNIDDLDSGEAYSNETDLQQSCSLFD